MPARFHFRLAPLLRLRESREREAQRQLAKAIEARNAGEAEIKTLQEAHQAAWQQKRCGTGEAIRLEQWAQLERYLLIMEKRILQAQITLQSLEQQVIQARQHLAQAHKEHLTLLRLKERRWAEHQQALLQQEVRESDEIAVLRFKVGHHVDTAAGGEP